MTGWTATKAAGTMAAAVVVALAVLLGPCRAAPEAAADSHAAPPHPQASPTTVPMSAFGQTEAPPPEMPKPKAAPPHAATPSEIAGKPLSKPASPVEASLRVGQVMLTGMIDRSVLGRDKTEIGHVIDVLVDDKGDEQALVVDVGGFMGVGNRRIALARALFHVPVPVKNKDGKDKDGQARSALQVDLDSAQVRSAPAFNGPGTVSVVTGAAPLPKPQDSGKPAAAADKKAEAPAADAASSKAVDAASSKAVDAASSKAADTASPTPTGAPSAPKTPASAAAPQGHADATAAHPTDHAAP